MKHKITVTPEELFFLAETMEGQYLDYDYLDGIEEFIQYYRRKKHQTIRNLEEKGIVEMEGLGEISISKEAKKLLSPIFFGESESELKLQKCSHRFYFLKDTVTYVKTDGKKIQITEGGRELLDKLIGRLEDENENDQKKLVDRMFIRKSQIEETIFLKNRTVGQTANVQELVKVDGFFLTPVNEKNVIYLDNQSLRFVCRQLLWGE